MNLVEKLSEWSILKHQLEALEGQISEEVILLGKTQEYGDVVATYRKSSTNGKYDYQGMVREIEPEPAVIEKYTKTEVKIDFKKIVEELKPEDALVNKYYTPPTKGVPTVTVSLKQEK